MLGLPRAFFFNGWSSSARSAHALGESANACLDFPKPTTYCIATQTRDLEQPFKATTALLQCQQTGQVPPSLFIQRAQHTINGGMLLSFVPPWESLAAGAAAMMSRPKRLVVHNHSPFFL